MGAEAALHAPHTAQRRLDDGAEIVSLARATGDRERLFDGHEHAFWAAWELGDPGARASQLDSMTRVAQELRQPAQLWMLAVAQATLALAEGRFDEAAELIARAAAVGERVQSWSAAAVAHTLPLFMLRREQGRLEDFEREIQGPGHEFFGPLVRQSVLAHLHARLGRTEEARAVLAELPHASLNTVAVPELALDSTSRPLGMLSALLGRFEDAARHFEEALRMNERMGARPWLAHAREEYAHMLLRRDAGDDRERAEELLSRARATYHELGMQV